MGEFSKNEKRLLEPYFTNLDKNVFVLKNLPQVVCGTVFSRYSRSKKPLRRLLLEEFMSKEEFEFDKIVGKKSNAGEELIAVKKAEEFYDRVLVDYGDDSVAELGGAHVGVEKVSNIAAKVLEDSRIGLSPLEKSTRYVYFEEKIKGEYQYYREPEIIDSGFGEEYFEVCDSLFETYAQMIGPMREFIIEKFPQEENVSDRAYKSTVKAKTCDVLRGLLPASTLTNLGLYGNGRSFEYLIQKMHANPLKEMHFIAQQMHEELSKVIPSFVKRATPENDLGKENIEFLRERDSGIGKFASDFLKGDAQKGQSVELVEYDENAENKVIAGLLYPFTDLSEKQIRKQVESMSAKEKEQIIERTLGKRKNRRHKAGRGFENTYYKFDIIGNFGIYRDLQRHRMLTQERQNITTFLGYDLPKEIEMAGFEDEYRKQMEKADAAFRKIHKEIPLHAQYVVPFAYRIRWYNNMNLREVYHLTELRSTQFGHIDYRRIAQQMYTKAKKVHPLLLKHANVDMNDYALERLEMEKGIDRKIESVKKKYEK